MLDVAGTVRELGQRLGVAELTLGADGQGHLRLDGERHLILDHRPEIGALYLRMLLRIPPRPDHELARLYRELLASNRLGERTGGAAFAIDAEEEVLELQARMPVASISTATVLVRIESLSGTAIAVANRLGLAFDIEDEFPESVLAGDAEPEEV